MPPGKFAAHLKKMVRFWSFLDFAIADKKIVDLYNYSIVELLSSSQVMLIFLYVSQRESSMLVDMY